MKDSGGIQNANFGILKNGQLFFGCVKHRTGLLQLTNVDTVLSTLQRSMFIRLDEQMEATKTEIAQNTFFEWLLPAGFEKLMFTCQI